MTTDEKLAAILAAIQSDPGNRGLARDPKDNLFTATKGDFAAACRSIHVHPLAWVGIVTGFYIPTASPPTAETDGPLGAVFLARTLDQFGYPAAVLTDGNAIRAVRAGLAGCDIGVPGITVHECMTGTAGSVYLNPTVERDTNHLVFLERVGPAGDRRCYTMRGRDITEHIAPTHLLSDAKLWDFQPTTIGIGDGGNEIGMGKISHETIVKNIPNGDLIHCRVPTDHLIVAGVSNWGAYALAAGLFVAVDRKPPADLFDPDRERQILEVMVREGPLVDGVTGQQTATVDGLTWEEYVKPLIRIREILES